MLETLKVELDIVGDSQDALLKRYIDKATNKIMKFTKQNKGYIDANLKDQVVDLAIIMYNRKGTEGLKSQAYSGTSESYLEDIPVDIKRELYTHRRLGGARSDK